MTVDPAAGDPDLVVDPVAVARRLGVNEPTEAQLVHVRDAILDAQADAEAAVNRPLFARTEHLVGVYPAIGLPMNQWRAWPDAAAFDDTVRVVSWSAVGGGRFDVELRVGLDGPAEASLVRFVAAHATELLRHNPAAGATGIGSRVVTSLGAEGQSISYAATPTAEGVAGALPTTKTLRHLRRYGAYKRTRPVVAPWPHNGLPTGYWP